MKLAVPSGKGGAGKTLTAVNLAAVAGGIYVDCDIEAPNGHLFFKPQVLTESAVAVKIPVVAQGLCDGCRLCVDFCRFNALAYLNEQVVVFKNVCHSCGGCQVLCPQQAVSEQDKVIGQVRLGTAGEVLVLTGSLNPGEASGTPIIRQMLAHEALTQAQLVVLDCPPGSACTVMESIRDADYCLLVAEPTVFGVHNLAMVYELVQRFGKPFGVVLNKVLPGDDPAKAFCRERQAALVGEIPFDPQLGRLSGNAEVAVWADAGYAELFAGILEKTMKEARHEAAVDFKRQGRNR